jgi:hypothetical protein
MKKNNILVFSVLSALVLLGGVHDQFKGTGDRLDPFLFYDYVKQDGTVGRLKANIYKEMGVLITVFTILFLWWQREVKTMRRVIFPFLFVSFLDVLDYILFYQQYAFVKLGVLILLIAWSLCKQLKK